MRTDIGFLRGLAAGRGLTLERPIGGRRTFCIVDPKTGGRICHGDRSAIFTPLQARRYLTALPERRWLAR